MLASQLGGPRGPWIDPRRRCNSAIAAVAAAGSLSKNWVFFFINWGSWRLWRSWRSYSGGCGGHGGRTLPYITYIKSGKSYHFVNGSIAHLQSIGLRSERGGFESRRRRCLFLGRMHKNANSFFINWGLWITLSPYELLLSPEQRLGVKRHKQNCRGLG